MRKKRAAMAAYALSLCLTLCIACGVRAQEAQENAPIYAGEEVWIYGMLWSGDGAGSVNLRQEPSMDAPLVGSYYSGIHAMASLQEGNWLLVEIGGEYGVRGYVMEKYFVTDGGEEESGFPVARLSSARDAWAFLGQSSGITTENFLQEDGNVIIGAEPWPTLAAGTRCVVLGESADAGIYHVQIGRNNLGFFEKQALEMTDSLSDRENYIPAEGIAVAHSPTPYAMPVYRFTDQTQTLSCPLADGDTVEYLASMDEWTQIRIGGGVECAFVPTQYVTLYPYESLYAPDAYLLPGEHTIECTGLYTFDCYENGCLRATYGGSTRTYDARGVYTMYLRKGTQVSVTRGTLSPVRREEALSDLSVDGIGVWDALSGAGRYLAGVQLLAPCWKQSSFVVTAQEGKECGYYRIENLDQDAGLSPPGEWIAVQKGEIADACLYHGQFIELRDARLAFFSGNG